MEYLIGLADSVLGNLTGSGFFSKEKRDFSAVRKRIFSDVNVSAVGG